MDLEAKSYSLNVVQGKLRETLKISHTVTYTLGLLFC